MKKNITYLLIVIVAASLLLFMVFHFQAFANPYSDLKRNNYLHVLDAITTEIVKNLPNDIHMRLLAIAPVKEDDGSFVDMLTEKIKAGTKYHLIERKDLDTLLEEQGIQLSAIADDRNSVAPGRIKGVEALMLGKIEKKIVSVFFCKMDIFIKLNYVEGGDIVFAKNFTARHVSMVSIYAGAALAVLILLLLAGLRIKTYKKGRVERLVLKDDIRQHDSVRILKKAKENLNRAHDILVEKNEIDLSTRMMEANREMKQLIQKIKQAPGMTAEATIKEQVRQNLDRAALLQANVRNALAESEKLYNAVKEKQFDKVQQGIQNLRQEMKNAMNRFHERSVGQI